MKMPHRFVVPGRASATDVAFSVQAKELFSRKSLRRHEGKRRQGTRPCRPRTRATISQRKKLKYYLLKRGR